MCASGYDARGFASAEEFVAAGGIDTYGCIVSDIHMPGMSGLDLKRLLVTRGCEVPVILITARMEAGLESRVLSTGAVCLLSKPFEADALIGCIENSPKW